MARKKLSIEEWKEFGADVKDVRARLMDVSLRISKVLSKREYRPSAKAIDLLDKVKSDLEDELCRQHPNEKNLTKFFYGM
jgi:predicted  nucleic acid-binding Zn-ribbon protein